MTTVLAVPSYQASVASVAQTTVGPPMGIAYLAGALLAAGEHVALVDGNAEELEPEALAARISSLRPTFVGMTASTPTIGSCGATARALRRNGYTGPIAVGGPHPSALPVRTLREAPELDVAVVGEAEGRIVELVHRTRSGASFADLPGVAWRESGTPRCTDPPRAHPDLDTLAPPARHLLPEARYRSPDSLHASTVVATRGCPAPCSYCQVPDLFGRSIRRRDPDAVADEVATLAQRGVDHVNFIDDTFTWDADWVHRLCAAFVARGLPRAVGWQCLTRVDRVDAALLATMRSAGCTRVEFGIECGTREGLRALHKHVSRDQLIDAFEGARRVGLETMALAMVNAPGEGAEAHRATWRLVRRLDPDQLQVSVCTPYPGTPLYEQALAEGRLRTDDWSRFRFLREAIFDNGVLSEAEALAAQRWLQRRFWLRPRVAARLGRRLVRDPKARPALIRAAAAAARHLLAAPVSGAGPHV